MTAGPSIQPRSAAAWTIAYSRDTWYAASGTSVTNAVPKASEFYFEVPLGTLSTGIDMRDRHMRENYLHTGLHPFVSYKGEITGVDHAGGDTLTVNTKGRVMEEAFEIKVRNHKDQAVEVVVRENLYRWSEWSVIEKSQAFEKKDAQTIEFPVRIAADGEAVITYRVRYTW